MEISSGTDTTLAVLEQHTKQLWKIRKIYDAFLDFAFSLSHSRPNSRACSNDFHIFTSLSFSTSAMFMNIVCIAHCTLHVTSRRSTATPNRLCVVMRGQVEIFKTLQLLAFSRPPLVWFSIYFQYLYAPALLPPGLVARTIMVTKWWSPSGFVQPCD